MHFLRPYSGWVVFALGLVLVSAFLGPLRPWLIQVAIDDHIVLGDLDGLFFIVALLFGSLLLEGGLAFGTTWLTQWIGQNAIFDVRQAVFRHLEKQPLAFFNKQPVGKLITRTTSDVESLSEVLSAGLITILGDLFRLFFIGAFMFYLDWRLALISLTVMPLMIWSVGVFRRKVREQYRETRTQVARLNTFLQEHISGMSVVQLFGREREEAKRFSGINDDHRKAHIKTVFYFALFWPAVEILSALALALVLWSGGMFALHDMVTLGVLVAFIQYVRQFFEPVRNLSDQYNTLQSAMAGAERIFEVLDKDASLPQVQDPHHAETLRGEITFENVWFAYDLPKDGSEPNWVLRDVSFTARPGESVVLVGATGSGKSTVINLLLRFYDIQKGRILVDGVDIRQYALEELRRHIGLVLQDVFLFSGSVEDNISLDNPDIPTAHIQDVLHSIGAHAFVERLPKGLAQDVQERGLALSQGQRQLISFARALVYNPAILVLDEATSSIDTETERLIQNAMDKLLNGRTSLVVAHRLSTIQHAEQILVMHRGEIRERGNHQSLLRQDGLYKRLYELQFRHALSSPPA